MTQPTTNVIAINRVTEHDVDEFTACPDLDNYQRFATKAAIYPGQGTTIGLSYCAHKLAGEAGELNEHYGKSWRDDGHISIVERSDGTGVMPPFGQRLVIDVKSLTAERRDHIIKEIGDCLWYLAALCNELGITLGFAALVNLRKLVARTDRGTQRGSGDDR